MITSNEILEKTFKTGHGYDRKEVDTYLKSIALEINELNSKIKNLEAQYNSVNDTVSYYKNLENTIQKTLVMAQKTADATIDSARKKACAIEEIAKAEAIKTITKAQNEYSEVRSKTIELLHQYENYRAQFKRLAMVQFDLINDKSFDISIANLKTDADKLSIDIDFDKLYNEYKTDYNERIYTEETVIPSPVEEDNLTDNKTSPEVVSTTIVETVMETPVEETPVEETPVAFEEPIFVAKEAVVVSTPVEKIEAEIVPEEKAETPIKEVTTEEPAKEEPVINSEEFDEIDNAFTNMLDQVLKIDKETDSDALSNDTTEDTLFKKRPKSKKIDKTKSTESDLNIGITFNNEEDDDLFSLDEDNFTLDSTSNNKDDEFIFDESDDDGIGITFDFLDK